MGWWGVGTSEIKAQKEFLYISLKNCFSFEKN